MCVCFRGTSINQCFSLLISVWCDSPNRIYGKASYKDRCVWVCRGERGEWGWFIPPVQLFPVRVCRSTTDCWNVFHEGRGTHKSSLESWKVCVFIAVDESVRVHMLIVNTGYWDLCGTSTWFSTVQLFDLRAAVCYSLMEGCGYWFMSSQLNCTLLCGLISNWHIRSSHQNVLCTLKGTFTLSGTVCVQ